jgi:hypothetical protein
MLQAIRSKVASWVAKALFAMLILSFAVWGIGDIFTQRTVQPNVATVGDTKVTSIQLDRAFRDLVAQYRQDRRSTWSRPASSASWTRRSTASSATRCSTRRPSASDCG